MNRLPVMYVRCLTAAFIAALEYTPHLLDTERVREEYHRVASRRNELELRLQKMADGVNWNSPKQVAAFLYGDLGFKELVGRDRKPLRTDAGAPKADAGTLLKLDARTKAQREFLEVFTEYNKLDSLLTKCLDFFLAICEQHDGKMYFSYNQGRARNHRLSSSGVPVIAARGAPQGQNIHREYKRLFTSPQGHKVGETDASQLEFRVGVDLSRDKQGIEDISTGVDVHSNTAATFTAAGEPRTRQEAKSATFRPMYGGTGTSRAEKAYKEFFTNRYTDLAGMQEKWCYDVLRASDRGLVMPWGIVYYFPEARMESSGYISGTTNIYNYGISGFATGDIVPIAGYLFWQAVRHLPIIPFSTVHDSVVSYVRDDAVEIYKEISKDCFTVGVYDFLSRVYDYKFVTPLGCGIKVAKNWGDTKQEVSYDYFPDTQTFKVKEK